MEKPIVDPTIPYIGPIYGSKFTPGKMVRIQGTTQATAYRFNIHLQCGCGVTPRDDVALQISVRLLEDYIIINSLQNGIWDEEQRGASMPIKRAEKFEIIVLCDFAQYKVGINGQHYCEFPQRVHYNRITHLAIDGDVSIMKISYESTAGDGMCTSAVLAPDFLSPTTEDSDFEVIDTIGPSAGIHSLPPSYGLAVHKEHAVQPFNSGSPYTVNASHSTAAPYPTSGAPYPTSGTPYPTSGAPYPTSGAHYPTSGAPYPTSGAPYLTSGAPYPALATTYPASGTIYAAAGAPYSTVGVPGMPPPPPGPPVPLNFSRPVQRSGMQKCCAVCLGGFFSILIIALISLKIARTF